MEVFGVVLEVACVGALAAGLGVAAAGDLASRIVPNGCVLAVATSGALRAAARGELVASCAGALAVLAVMLVAAAVTTCVRGESGVGGGDVNDVGAEFFFNAGDKLVAAGIVALVDDVNASLVKGDGVGGGEETDVGHTGSGGVGVAVAVNGDVDHGGDVGGAVLEIAVNAGSGVAHSSDEGKLSSSHIVAVGLTGAVDVFLAVGGSAADGELFEGAAEAAHSVAFEVGEHE